MTLINKIVIGAWPVSGDFGAVPPSRAEAVLVAAVEAGINKFDVAPNYGLGYAESLLGMVFAGDEGVNIYTKCGNRPFIGKDFSPDALRESVDQSLKRLRRKFVSGIFLHNPRDEAGDINVALDALSELKAEGLIGKIGISGAKGYDYSSAADDLINIYQQDANLLYLDELQTSFRPGEFFARSPLATGILSGRLTNDTTFHSDDHRSAWLKGDRLASLIKRVEAIKAVLPSGMSVASAARRFLLARKDIDYVICGVNKPSHIDDLVSDAEAGPLDNELVRQLQGLHDDNFGLPEKERSLGY